MPTKPISNSTLRDATAHSQTAISNSTLRDATAHSQTVVPHKMKGILTIILICIPSLAWTCTCVDITQEDARKRIQQAEFVIEGVAVENIHHNIASKTKLDNTNHGFQIKLKVHRVIKGQLESEFIYINQFESQNCIQEFKLGESYVIVGTRIHEFVNQRLSNKNDEDEFMELTEVPPSPITRTNKKNSLNCYNIDQESVDKWNQMAKNKIVLYTDQCNSFLSESTYGKYFNE